ncbi:ATPdependent RNA helicase [Gaertneriomyces sp. JEL0708]|nr:ATPdependent RNA helicase [Gaertneriomyces sp. JEL0708]
MAGGRAARANKQKSGGRPGRSNGKRRGVDGAKRKGGRHKEDGAVNSTKGGEYRGMEILYDPVTGEVATVGKKIAKQMKELSLQQKCKRKTKKSIGEKSAPEIEIRPFMVKELRRVLGEYRAAQEVLGEMDGVSDEEEDEEIDEVKGRGYVKSESKHSVDNVLGIEGARLVQELNADGFYDRRIDDETSCESNDGSISSEESDHQTESDVGTSSEGSEQETEETEDEGSEIFDDDVDAIERRTANDLAQRVSQTYLEALMQLGFSRTAATHALQRTRNNYVLAILHLYARACGTLNVPKSEVWFVDLDLATVRDNEEHELRAEFAERFVSETRVDGTQVWRIEGLCIPVTFCTAEATEFSSDTLAETLQFTLELHHSFGTMYPNETPAIAVLPTCVRPKDMHRIAAVSLGAYLNKLAKERIGECLGSLLVAACYDEEAQKGINEPSAGVLEVVIDKVPPPRSNSRAGAIGTTRPATVMVITNDDVHMSEKARTQVKSSNDHGFRPFKKGPIPTRRQLPPGTQVAITLKEDQGTDRLTYGCVRQLLTKSNVHPRGIKVILENGQKGRVQFLVPSDITQEASTRQTNIHRGDTAGGRRPGPKRVGPAAKLDEIPTAETTGGRNNAECMDLFTPTRSSSATAGPIPTLASLRKGAGKTQSIGYSPQQPPPSVLPASPRVMASEEIREVNEKLHSAFTAKQQRAGYKKMLEERRKLPAWALREYILSAVNKHRVIVVEGETGCGKTTQVPQFILDHHIEHRNGAKCKILVTQPRRISAIGVAERVACERDEQLGKSVGYQIRLETCMSEETRILFATTGILVRRLEGVAGGGNGHRDGGPMEEGLQEGIEGFSHIIIDEVHERSLDSDFLLMVLRDLLATRPDVKIILMSATINAGLFQSYFETVTPTPRIHIPGRTFPVEVMFLEDAVQRTAYEPSGREYTAPRLFSKNPNPASDDEDIIPDGELDLSGLQKRYKHVNNRTVETLNKMDLAVIHYPLIESLVTWIVQRLIPGVEKKVVGGDFVKNRNGRGSGGRGGKLASPGQRNATMTEHATRSTSAAMSPNRAILIFLPGYAEISTCHDMLLRNSLIRTSTKAGKFLIPLHGNLNPSDQLKVFQRPEDGFVKIVIATNVAETSITVDDVVFVIDSGKMKETRYDPRKGMQSLEEVWVSRANALQRRGRAGRVQTGTCIHLFTSHQYEHGLSAQQLPEMQRVALDQLCLRVKILGFLDGKIGEVLAKVIEPPTKESVDKALDTLRALGALTKGEVLTPLGWHLGRLPVDVRIGKLLIYGTIFQCLDPVLTVAAAMSLKSPFYAPFDKRDQADRKRREFKICESDHLTTLNAYDSWITVRAESAGDGGRAERQWLFDNFLSGKTFNMIMQIKRQLIELLSSIGFLPATRARDVERVARAFPTGDGCRAALPEVYNSRSDDVELLKSLLVAAMYPHVVKCSGGSKVMGDTPQFVTRGDEQCFIHPTSVNFASSFMYKPFLVYLEKVKTSKVYIRDSTIVTPTALAFFGGKLTLDNKKDRLFMDDGWINFRARREVALAVEGVRAALDELLLRRIEKPSASAEEEDDGGLVDIIVKVVNMAATEKAPPNAGSEGKRVETAAPRKGKVPDWRDRYGLESVGGSTSRNGRYDCTPGLSDDTGNSAPSTRDDANRRGRGHRNNKPTPNRKGKGKQQMMW